MKSGRIFFQSASYFSSSSDSLSIMPNALLVLRLLNFFVDSEDYHYPSLLKDWNFFFNCKFLPNNSIQSSILLVKNINTNSKINA